MRYREGVEFQFNIIYAGGQYSNFSESGLPYPVLHGLKLTFSSCNW